MLAVDITNVTYDPWRCGPQADYPKIDLDNVSVKETQEISFQYRAISQHRQLLKHLSSHGYETNISHFLHLNIHTYFILHMNLIYSFGILNCPEL